MKSNRNTTLDDIAKAVGISRSAVGKVLGANNSNIRVSQQKAEIIRQMAVKMNYTPNINARALAGQASRIIGVLMDSQAPEVNFRRVAAIERKANECGYRIMIGEAHDSAENLYGTYVHMRQHGIDGTICVSHDYPGESNKIEQYFANCGPMVFLGAPERREHSHVILAADVGIRLAVTHLLERGRKKIALLSAKNSEYQSVKAREKGFLEAFPGGEDMILPFPEQKCDIPQMRRDIQKIIHEMLIPRGIDAILAPNDLVALTIQGEFLAMGLQIPGDIALVGFDNEPFSECAPIPITTIDQNNDGIAAYAVNMLLDIIQDKSGCCAARKILIKPELVVRQTT